MTPADLIRRFPRLWHMAEDGSWPSIEEHGLLSTSALLDLYEIDGAPRIAIEQRHRPSSVRLSHPKLSDATVRDQIPMSDRALVRCLDDGLTPSAWYALLNGRVFFWPTRKRLFKLLGADTYRDQSQTVLTIDTESLVSAYADTILLSPINSGSTIMNPARRGLSTFAKINDFPLEAHRRRPGHRQDVAEVAVLDRVVPIRDHVLAVHRVQNDRILKELWQSPRASSEDGP